MTYANVTFIKRYAAVTITLEVGDNTDEDAIIAEAAELAESDGLRVKDRQDATVEWIA